jgi:hypothetical protein
MFFHFQVPGYLDWFNIIYIHPADPAVYTYQLLRDYEEGNLTITVA